MDSNQCNTLIPAARGAFGQGVRDQFGQKGEW